MAHVWTKEHEELWHRYLVASLEWTKDVPSDARDTACLAAGLADALLEEHFKRYQPRTYEPYAPEGPPVPSLETAKRTL